MDLIKAEEFTVYDNLIKELYQSPNIESLKDLIIDSIHRLVQTDSLAFFLVNPQNNYFLSTHQLNLPDRMFEDYKNYYEKFDIYKQKVFSLSPVPIVDRCSDYFNFNEWARNEHRCDFLMRNGCHYIACIQIFNGSSIVGELSMHRSRNHTDFSDKDMFFLKCLQPHLSHAFSNANHKSSGEKLKSMLTVREYQVVQLMVRGLNRKEIAEELVISVDTVKTHMKNIYSKTNCKTCSEVIYNFFVK